MTKKVVVCKAQYTIAILHKEVILILRDRSTGNRHQSQKSRITFTLLETQFLTAPR